MFKFQGSSGRCSSGIANERKPRNDERVLMDCGGEVVVGRYVDGSFVSRSWGHTESDVRLWCFVAESSEMVSLLVSIGKGLWAFLVLGLGLLSVFLLVLFLGGFLVDVIKDIIERIKKK
jgi:hypothetical protein